MPEELESRQKELCARLGAPYLATDPKSKAGLALDSLDGNPIYGVRLPPANGISGWYIHAGEYRGDDDFYDAVHVSHLNELLPEVLPYLGLAPGYRFIIDGQGYEDVWYQPHV